MRARKIRILDGSQSSIDSDQPGDFYGAHAQIQQPSRNRALLEWQLQLLRGGDVQRVVARSKQCARGK